MNHRIWSGAFAMALGACIATPAAAADDSTPPVAEKVEQVATTVKQAVVRGARAAASGIERGTRAATHGIKVGVRAAASGIETGAKATARAADIVVKKVNPDAP